MSVPRPLVPPPARALGERVLLRKPTLADQDGFLALMHASRELHRPWSWPPQDAAEYQAYLRRDEGDDFEALLACRREDGLIAGFFNLSQIARGNFSSAYLGYAATAPCAGQGLMREALRLVLRHAFGTLGLHRLEANVQPGNERSIALVRGAGFRREGFSPRYLRIGGEWRDHERWALLAEELGEEEPGP